MLNYIWGGMMLIAVIFGLLTGRMTEVTNALLSGASDGVTLTISLAGAMCLWGGLMEITDKSGITLYVSKALFPLFKLIFKGMDKTSASAKTISMNVAANLLGLGNAATPLGLAAMKELQKENRDKRRASDNMVAFVVLNTASIQLIPTTVAILRAKSGSATPMDIMPAVWITSILSLAAGMVVCKLFMGRARHD